jgi:DNA polymerase V
MSLSSTVLPLRKGRGRPKGSGTYGEDTKPVRVPVTLLGDVLRFVQNKGYRVPLCDSPVPAGDPAELSEYLEEYVDLNEYLLPHPENTYLIRVRGDSMIEANIQEGDLLIVDMLASPGNGSIVIASVDHEATVKRYYERDGRIILVPENSEYEPILISDDQHFEVQGVVTHIIHAAKPKKAVLMPVLTR